MGGNTEIGIDTKIKLVDYRVFINVSKVSELQSFSIVTVNGREMLEIGANITLNELIKNLKEFKVAFIFHNNDHHDSEFLFV